MTMTPLRRYLPTLGSFKRRPPEAAVRIPSLAPSSAIAWSVSRWSA